MSLLNHRRALVFVGVWGGLFVATLLMRAACSTEHNSSRSLDANHSADVFGELTKEATRAKLDGIPRRSPRVAELDESLDGVLRSKISELNNSLYACMSHSLEGATVRTNYFEISFIPSPHPSLDALTTVGTPQISMSHVVLERSTVAFDAEDEACLLRNLEGVFLDGVPLSFDRMTYVMCVTRRLDSSRG